MSISADVIVTVRYSLADLPVPGTRFTICRVQVRSRPVVSLSRHRRFCSLFMMCVLGVRTR